MYIYHMENFKEIKDFETRYLIGDNGTVISLPKEHPSGFNGRGITRREKRVLTSTPDKNGYSTVCISKDKKVYSKKIHRLIAEMFIPNPENKPEVNHIDGNKANNNISNLEWCTKSENTKHAYAAGLRVSKIQSQSYAAGMLTAKPIIAYCYKTNKELWRAESIKSAARLYNLDERTVHRVLYGIKNYNSCKGMYFKLA